MATPSEQNKGKERKGSQQGHTSASGGALTSRSGALTHGGFEPLHRLREEFNRLFDRFGAGWLSPWEGSGRSGHWELDVQEDDGSVVVRAEAPGFEPSDFDIQVRGDHLVLRAAHKGETEEKERGYREWRQQELYQSVLLPADVDADKVEATYRNGILNVALPKTEQSKGRRIEVRT